VYVQLSTVPRRCESGGLLHGRDEAHDLVPHDATALGDLKEERRAHEGRVGLGVDDDLEAGEVLQDHVHLGDVVEPLELLNELHHVVAHRRVVEVVRVRVVLNDRVLNLDLLNHGLAERVDGGGALEGHPLPGFVLDKEGVKAVVLLRVGVDETLGQEEAGNGGLVKELPEAKVPPLDVIDLNLLGGVLKVHSVERDIVVSVDHARKGHTRVLKIGVEVLHLDRQGPEKDGGEARVQGGRLGEVGVALGVLGTVGLVGIVVCLSEVNKTGRVGRSRRCWITPIATHRLR